MFPRFPGLDLSPVSDYVPSLVRGDTATPEHTMDGFIDVCLDISQETIRQDIYEFGKNTIYQPIGEDQTIEHVGSIHLHEPTHVMLEDGGYEFVV